MTKTNIEKLTELREKAHGIATKNPTTIALEVKTAFADDTRKLKDSEDYKDMGTAGRMKKEEQLREKYRKQLFELLAEQKAEYKKLADEAKTLAKTALTTPNPITADALTVKLFEQELQSLQTSTLLGMNANANIQALDAFISKHGDDPYFAGVIRDNFAQFSQNILSIEGSPKNRQALAKAFERVELKAASEEQVLAKETLQAFGDSIPTFYREGLPQAESLATIIGNGHSTYLNEPEKWLEAQAQAEQAE